MQIREEREEEKTCQDGRKRVSGEKEAINIRRSDQRKRERMRRGGNGLMMRVGG